MLDQGDKDRACRCRADVDFDFTAPWPRVMLDATLASVDEVRNVPVYMRAAEIRQLARGEFAAKKVEFSTSEFYTPHYHIGASEAYLRDITPQLGGGGGGGGSGGGDVQAPGDLGFGGDFSAKTFAFQVKDATINALREHRFSTGRSSAATPVKMKSPSGRSASPIPKPTALRFSPTGISSA